MASVPYHYQKRQQQLQFPPPPQGSFCSETSLGGNSAGHNASTNINAGGGSGSFYYTAEGPNFVGALEDLDPSLVDGFRVIYDREVPIEVRLAGHGSDADAAASVDYEAGGLGAGTSGGAARSSLEAIKCKLLILGDPDRFTSLRLELSSEADLFFHYIHALDEEDYADLQRSQRLMVDFAHLPVVMTRMLNMCIADPSTHLAILTQDPRSGMHYSDQGSAKLEFIQNMEYKFVELLTCPCVRLPEELVQRHITYRYNSLKLRLAQTTGRLADLTNLVKLKNPSLLLQLNKAMSAAAGAVGSSSGGTTPATTSSSSHSPSHMRSLAAGGGVGDASLTHGTPSLSSPPGSSTSRSLHSLPRAASGTSYR
jgi:hypothetical protein